MTVTKYVLISLLLSLTACGMQPSYETYYLHNQPGTVTLLESQDSAIFEVNNQFGIGKANITLIKGDWIDPTIIRLNLAGLEGFTANNGLTSLTKEQLTVIEGNGYFDVTLPANFLAESDTVTISWIDFYRQ